MGVAENLTKPLPPIETLPLAHTPARVRFVNRSVCEITARSLRQNWGQNWEISFNWARGGLNK